MSEAPKWWHCPTHGPGKANAWGCPECVMELRAENESLRARLAEAERDAARWRFLVDSRHTGVAAWTPYGLAVKHGDAAREWVDSLMRTTDSASAQSNER